MKCTEEFENKLRVFVAGVSITTAVIVLFTLATIAFGFLITIIVFGSYLTLALIILWLAGSFSFCKNSK